MSFLSPTAGLRQRSLFYGHLATLLGAGLPIARILEQLINSPPDPALRKIARRIQHELEHQSTWTEAFRAVPGWTPAFDLALIEAGERSGRLSEAFETLARHHRHRADSLRRMLQSSAYTVITFHVAVMIIPIPAWVSSGDFVAYLLHSVGVLAAIYGLLALIIWAASGQRQEAWRAALERFTLKIPVLGSARSALALGRLAGSLEALISAGVLITEGWPMAARASGSPLIVRVVETWPPQLESGQTPGELVAESGLFPTTFVSAYSTGEISGRLDEQLLWLARHYEQEGYQRLQVLATAAPTIGYIGVAAWIVLYVIATFSGYVNIINQLLGA